MEKIKIQKQPTRGGLSPVRVDDLPYKDGSGTNTVQLICKEIIIRAKTKEGLSGDSIETRYERRVVDGEGDLLRVDNLSYIITDKGEVLEYDVYEFPVFEQSDIDDEETVKTTDEDGNILSITRDGFEVANIHGAGDIDYTTETVFEEALEPLADWTASLGEVISAAVINQMLARNGY